MAETPIKDNGRLNRDIISLREYVDIRFEAQKEAVNIAMAAADRAVTKAEAANERRFESVNEFRAALSDSSRLLMPRAEIEIWFSTMTKKVDELAIRLDKSSAKMDSGVAHGRGLSDAWGILLGAAAFIASIVAVFAAFKF